MFSTAQVNGVNYTEITQESQAPNYLFHDNIIWRTVKLKKTMSLEMDLSVVCLLMLVLVCHGAGLNDKFQKAKCKKHGPAMRFPFRLDKQPEYCGYPGFVLSCNQRNETVTTRIPDPWPAHRQGSPPRFHAYANPNLHTNLS